MIYSQLFSNISSFEVWLHTAQTHTEVILSAQLPPADTTPTNLHHAMRYAVLDGGKRIRPLLSLAAGELCGASPMTALTVGCAVELIHAYSLVHDDMPCMDNDILRRGKPTVHIKYGESCALLVGDALQAAAFELLTQALPGVNSSTALQMIGVLANHAGANGMVGGQQMDLLAEKIALDNHQQAILDLPALQILHRKKTGALLAASVKLGALAGYKYDYDNKLADALERYSAAIGLGFQITDDILDTSTDIALLGKTPGKDAAQGKSTYVSLLGLEGAKSAAQACLNDALNAIEPYDATRLRDLAYLIVGRLF
jgi:farnesyl diphosphate synthase